MPQPFDATTKDLVELHPEDWLAYLGLPRAPVEVVDADVSTVSAAADKVLHVDPPPSAIFSGNNLMSIGVLQTIANRRLIVPDDIAMVGFDDFPYPWSDAFRPHLTTVAQPAFEIGRTAAELLLARVREPSLPSRQVVLETRLVVRSSCGFESIKATSTTPLVR